jgi:ATP-dependent Zn protease
MCIIFGWIRFYCKKKTLKKRIYFCFCFFIGKSRDGRASDDGDAADRIFKTILTEMDGMRAKNNVLIIGAATSKDIVDSTIQEPGKKMKNYLFYLEN